jgi:hypothetical protein
MSICFVVKINNGGARKSKNYKSTQNYSNLPALQLPWKT